MSNLGTNALANYASVIEELEQLRKKTKRSKQIVQTGIVIVCILMVVGNIGYFIALFNYSFENINPYAPYDPYGPMMDAEYWNIIWIFMGFLAFTGGPFIYLYIQNQKTIKLFQDKYYNELIEPLLQATYPMISYQQKGKIHNSKVVKSSRYKKFVGVEQRLCKHYISGTVGQSGIEIGQTNIKAVKDYKTPTASNKTGAIGTDNFFKGLVVYLSPNYSSNLSEQLTKDKWEKNIQQLQQYWGVRVLVTAIEENVILDIPFRGGKSFLSPPTDIALDSSTFATQLDNEIGLLFELASSLNAA